MKKAKVIFEQETSSCVRLRYPSADLAHLIAYYVEISVPQDHPEDFSITALPSLNTLIALPINDFEKRIYDHATGGITLLKGPKLLGNLTEAISCAYPPGAIEFSIKFMPGVLQVLLDLPAASCCNQQLDASAYLPQALLNESRQAIDFAGRTSLIETYLRPKIGSLSSIKFRAKGTRFDSWYIPCHQIGNHWSRDRPICFQP